MKWLYYGIGIPVVGVIVFFGAIYFASEVGGEVVVLHRTSADRSVARVRLWIVEDEEHTWIEHGAPDAHWITRLTDDPMLTLERNDQTDQYHAQADPEAHDQYHTLRSAKYGFADSFVALVSGDVNTCSGVPVRIRPVL